MARKDTPRESFEEIYSRLEASVERLEKGGLTLDEAIALYEDGMTLARTCQARLDEAELKITKLKESFAPASHGIAGERADGAPDDYEYVDEDAEQPELDAEPFA